MPPESLRCKECKTTYPLDARYVCERCFGPLEVAYDRRATDADPAALRRRIQAGPHSLWRYGDFLPVQAPPAGPLPAGWTPLLRADRLAERLGLREVWIKNDAANPTHSFKDRVVSVALARARELGFADDRLRLDRQPRQRRRRPRGGGRAWSPTSSSRPTSRSRRCWPPGCTAPTWSRVRGNYDDVNRLCTELSGRARVGVREHQHAPLLRRGVQDARVRDRRAARLRAARPGRGADRLGLAVHEDRPRASRSGSSSGCSRASCRPSTAPRRPAARRWPPRSRHGHDFCRPVKPDTIAKSLAIGNPADGPYALDLARRTGGIDRLGDRRRDPRGHQAAGPDDRHLHRDRRRRHRPRCLAKLAAARRHRPRRAGRRVHHRRGSEDARRACAARSRRGRSSRRSSRSRRPPSASSRSRIRSGAMAVTRQDPNPAAVRHRRRGEGQRRRRHGRRGPRRPVRPLRRAAQPDRRGRRRCAGSSTCTSTARTSASWTASTPRSRTATRSRSCRPSPAAERAVRMSALHSRPARGGHATRSGPVARAVGVPQRRPRPGS